MKRIMNKNIRYSLLAVLYIVFIAIFPYNFSGGFFLPFITLVVSILISREVSFESYQSKQIYFLTLFIVLIIASNYKGATLHSGNLFTNNFEYFLNLTIIPISIFIVLGIGVYYLSLKEKYVSNRGLSVYLIRFFVLVCFVMMFSVMLYALSGHSV